MTIIEVKGREILDSRGNPTIEAEVTLASGAKGVASSEFYHDGIYDYTVFEGAKGVKRTSDEQVAYLEELISKYPIDPIEDGMDQNDWDDGEPYR